MHPENIRPRQWIVVTKEKPKEMVYEGEGWVEVIPYPPQGGQEYRPPGIPIQVLAVSYPFLVGKSVLAPNDLVTVDLQSFEVSTVTKQYVNVFKRAYRHHEE